ncbi:DUF4386 domain-containing protein [Nocardioides glacieisoli]|uniref:DUF4386 domain-containing protein n=1 Tax=Nocardioides glacieisoli TaxID=1168730 RepID=UPI0013EAF7AF|nr:DUF4386 domain-containing protein [Nocardioides glacieisoli]
MSAKASSAPEAAVQAAAHPDNITPVGNSTRALRPRAVVRTAGVLYLVNATCGLFSELVRGRLVDVANPSGTAARIGDSEALFRIGIAADLVGVISGVGIAVLLYVLLRPVSRTLALGASSFLIVQCAILGMNLLHQVDAVMMLDPAGAAGSLPTSQRDALVAMSMDSHVHGYLIALVFGGVHLAILGYLVARASYFPTWLGVLMIVAGAGYLTDSSWHLLVPAYDGAASSAILAPTVMAEIATTVWLLGKGVDDRRFWAAENHRDQVAP